MGVQINGSEGNVIATKGTFSGDVGIGGTLTYEDVTNIDSVGLVTARSGIEIGARPGVAASISVDGNMIVSGISTFGGDVQVPDKIIHSGDTNTAIRFPAADTITAETAGSERLRIISTGEVGINVTPSNGQMLAITGRSGYDDIVQITAVGTNMGARINLTNTGSGVSRINATNNSLALQTAGSERLRIDSSGKILIGDDTAENTMGLNANVQTFGTDASTSGVAIKRGSDDAQAAFLVLSKSRNASVGSRTILNNGDEVGNIFFVADDGTDLISNTAAIKSQIDAAPGANDTPGNLSFWTTSDGANSATNRMTIDRNGNVTTPYQFHIEVRRTDDQTGYNAGGDFGIPMVFTDVVTTRGTTSSALNTSTGKITVPLDGVYFLEASVVVSGSVIQQVWFTEGNSRMQYSDHTENAMTTRVQSSGMHYLSANTQVGVKPYGSGSSSITILDSIYHTWFRVTLIG